MRKNNKYAFNNSYYKRSYSNALEGNNARELASLPEYEEEYEEEYAEEVFEEEYVEKDFNGYTEEREKVNRNDVKAVVGKKVKYKRSYHINLGAVAAVLVSLGILFYAASGYIKLESELNLMDKQIKATEMELSSIQAKNASLAVMLDKEIDRNYIYTVAVSQLGMTYPDDNQVIGYQTPDSGYVKQYGEIPANR